MSQELKNKNSVNSRNNLLRWLSSHFTNEEAKAWVRFGNLPSVTLLINCRAKIPIQVVSGSFTSESALLTIYYTALTPYVT